MLVAYGPLSLINHHFCVRLGDPRCINFLGIVQKYWQTHRQKTVNSSLKIFMSSFVIRAKSVFLYCAEKETHRQTALETIPPAVGVGIHNQCESS